MALPPAYCAGTGKFITPIFPTFGCFAILPETAWLIIANHSFMDLVFASVFSVMTCTGCILGRTESYTSASAIAAQTSCFPEAVR